MSGSSKKKSTKSTTESPFAKVDQKEGPPNNGLSTGDVKVGMPVDVQSIITQVDRNAPPVKLTLTTETPTTNNSSSREKSGRSSFSFFSRLVCCGSNNETVPQNIQMATVPKSSNRVSQQSQPSNNGSFRTILQSGTQNVRNHPLPVRMPDMGPLVSGKKCLALDLDETLVHSSFQPVESASFIITVVIDGTVHNVYVLKRPGVDDFLIRMAQCYELIIYTASLSKYADPLLDLLDPEQTISKRLFRENCVFFEGHYVKDLSLLQRDISQTIIVDNSPMSYIFHPENAIDCVSFFDNPHDVELWQVYMT